MGDRYQLKSKHHKGHAAAASAGAGTNGSGTSTTKEAEMDPKNVHSKSDYFKVPAPKRHLVPQHVRRMIGV